MKKLCILILTSILFGCLGTNTTESPPSQISIIELPEDFDVACYGGNNQSAQNKCDKDDGSCVENHYVTIGFHSDLRYLPQVENKTKSLRLKQLPTIKPMV